MSSGTATSFAGNLLKLQFQAVAIANVADNAASSPFTNVYLSLHTASPGAGGSQTTTEAAYTSYARVAGARTSGGWSNASNVISNAADMLFPAATGGSETETDVGVGTASSGAGILWYYGTLTSSRLVNSGITPRFLAGALTVTLT